MGIGTSLGAYFDTQLDHHAGNEYVNPKDDNVIDVEPDKKAWGKSPSPLTEDMNNISPAVMDSMRDNPNYFIPIADTTNNPEPVDPSHYDTALTPDQETKFQDWKSKNAPNDSGHDYDLRGAFLNKVTPDEKTGHWPDTFKKPNHPTFSDQSMYAGERPDLAGRWQGDTYIPPLPASDL